MANGLLLHVCCWWMGHKRWILEGAVGSCDVVGILVWLHGGGGEMLHVLAVITLDDGPGLGTLGSNVVGDCGCSTFGGGVPVASGFVAPRRSIGRRISCSFCMAWVRAMDALVEVGTVPLRAVRVSVAGRIVRSTDDIVGVAQCIGYSCHVLATQYHLVPGI
jgi:hypothetical protein